MQPFLNFLAHGGIKLIILAVALVAHIMKRNAEKALREGKPRDMPNAMPSQNAMTVQTPTAPTQPNLPQVPTIAPPPPAAPKPSATPPLPASASKPKARSDSGSPWSSSTNPFDRKKK